MCPSRPPSLLFTSSPSAPLWNLLNNTSRNSLKKWETQRGKKKKTHSLSLNHALFKRTAWQIRPSVLTQKQLLTDAYRSHEPHQSKFPLSAAYLWENSFIALTVSQITIKRTCKDVFFLAENASRTKLDSWMLKQQAVVQEICSRLATFSDRTKMISFKKYWDFHKLLSRLTLFYCCSIKFKSKLPTYRTVDVG